MGCLFSCLWKTRLKMPYQILDTPISQGAFSNVYRAKNINRNTGVIIKRSRYHQSREFLEQEAGILQQMCHPNIIQLLDVYTYNTQFHLVLEYGGTELYYVLDSYVDGLPESIAQHYSQQILSAVSYCHSKKIVHRDIKPENITVLGVGGCARIKLIDFGFATRFNPNQYMNRFLGSPEYIAPEVIIGYYTEKCDLWSVGVVIHMMLFHKFPFFNTPQKTLYKSICNDVLDFSTPIWENITNGAKQCIASLLDKNPDGRIITEWATLS